MNDMHWSSSYAHYYLGIAYYERNDLAKAEEHLNLLLQQPDLYGTVNVFHSALPLGLLYMAKEQPNKARETLQFIADLAYQRQNALFITLSAVLKAELDLREGKTQAAIYWAGDFKLGPLMAMHRFYVPELTYVNAMLAIDDQEEASAVLNRLESHTHSIHHTNTRIKVLALQALLAIRQADEATALVKLEQAVILARSGGFIRYFVDLGSAEIADLLRQLQHRGVASTYIARILAAFPTNGAGPKTAIPSQPLIEPLTYRELEVLELLADRLTNKEIADKLVISLSTVKQHSHNIYQKLQVKNRRQAADKATSLKILNTPTQKFS